MRALLLLALVAVAVAAPLTQNSAWDEFKVTFEKTYAHPSEELLRSKIFHENLELIEKHNELYQKGEKTFEMGINQFSDLLLSETVDYKGYGIKGQEPPKRKSSSKISFDGVVTTPVPIPEDLDWRYYNVVTPIKNQGQCGSCWAFSSTGALEGQMARLTGKLPSLSEQNLMDCTNNNKYNNAGCNGGWMENAWQYVADNNGIDSEESYPYLTKVQDSCNYDPANKAGYDVDYVDLPVGKEDALLEAVGSIAPISVAINAKLQSFMNYRSGVYYDADCANGAKDLDHAPLVIGYGHDTASGMDYWLVKNSWGTTWGDEGFIKMARNQDNNCGIATHATYPIY